MSIFGPQTAAQRLQRRLTDAFVEQAPVEIALAGVEETSSGSGAKARTRLRERPPVIVTLVEPSDSGYRSPVRDDGGSRQAIDYELVASWGTDVRDGDVFSLGEHQYRVEVTMVPNDYEVRALVYRVK